MSDEVLEKLVKDYMRLGFPLAGFAWQGGEPTLMGLDFYKKTVELQKKYGSDGQEVGNSLQTNAILLNDEWCVLEEASFPRNQAVVDVSITGDGTQYVFEDYVEPSGQGRVSDPSQWEIVLGVTYRF